jgi:hypothetical protein
MRPRTYSTVSVRSITPCRGKLMIVFAVLLDPSGLTTHQFTRLGSEKGDKVDPRLKQWWVTQAVPPKHTSLIIVSCIILYTIGLRIDSTWVLLAGEPAVRLWLAGAQALPVRSRRR